MIPCAEYIARGGAAPMQPKTQFRDSMRKRRSELSPREVRARSEHVIARLAGREVYRRAECLASYVSVRNEVHTHSLIESALGNGKRVAVPVALPNRVLVHREIRSLAELRPSKLGLMEPSVETGSVVPPETFDVIVVPGLAFDRAGNRIGFGAGYYDRFLSLTPAIKIGLAFDFQLFDRLPADPLDISMDLVITESEIHTTGKG